MTGFRPNRFASSVWTNVLSDPESTKPIDPYSAVGDLSFVSTSGSLILL